MGTVLYLTVQITVLVRLSTFLPAVAGYFLANFCANVRLLRGLQNMIGLHGIKHNNW